MIIVLLAAVPVYAAAVTTASKVYGQGGSFTTNTANKGGLSAKSIDSPVAGVFDKNGNLYVADANNNRVLFYPAGSTTATRVYGQGGSFTTNGANKGGINAKSINYPWGVALDGSGNLYVSDCNNNRVLGYPAGSTTAVRVYGQGGSFTTNTANKGGISANSLYCPIGVAVDKKGNVYISDYENSRVLYYPSASTTATRVYGQGGSFTTNTENKGGISADSLDYPGLITLDKNSNLYVADYNNNRVLYYPSGSTTATRVAGQGGSLTTNTANKGGISAKSLSYPWGIAVDGSGNLYVADYDNNRVLYYPMGSSTATTVYGQFGSFTANTANNGGISASSLYYPLAVALDGSGNLYVFDGDNNRVLGYK
jgi:sugar lactone lactonase YvrE